ncbi:MAG: hypothetical protein ACOY0T_17810 [Myxococcota bacterium]
MFHRFYSACLVALACGGGAPPKSADDAEAVSPKEEAADAKEPAPERAASETSEASSSAGPASPEDVRDVLQLVLDDDALAPYLHLDRPDRFPVRVSGRDLPANVELTKATKPVVIVPEGDTEKKPTIVFTEIKVNGDEASVRYRYDVEKLRGSSSLKRRDGHWVLIRSRVTEH